MPGDTRFVITPNIKRQIIDIIDERIAKVHVTKEDFSELKSIVRDLAEAQKRTGERLEELAEAQKRTESRLEELTIAQKELADAQKRTEVRLEELAEAQKRTESRLEELAIAQKELADAQKRTEARVEELAMAQMRTEARVEELAMAQMRTEARVEELAMAQMRTEARVEELAMAQKRTEARVEELAMAQMRTEARVEELAQAQKRTEEEVKKLAEGLNDTRIHLGGLSRSFSYAFENEAYRNVPRLLQEQYGFEIKEKMVRAEVGGKEINFFCKAEKNGKVVYIVGESKVRLDEGKWRKEIYDELEDKVNAVQEVYGDVVIQPILVTHFATKGFIDEAKEKGIIVIQSYEW